MNALHNVVPRLPSISQVEYAASPLTLSLSHTTLHGKCEYAMMIIIILSVTCMARTYSGDVWQWQSLCNIVVIFYLPLAPVHAFHSNPSTSSGEGYTRTVLMTTCHVHLVDKTKILSAHQTNMHMTFFFVVFVTIIPYR